MDRGVALVTGGSRGIGAAVARAAAAKGWAVCLTYNDDAAAAAAVVGEIEAAGGVATAVRADIAVEADVLGAFAAAEAMGPLTAARRERRHRRPEVAGRRADRRARRAHPRGQRARHDHLLPRGRPAALDRHGGQGGSIVLVSSAAARLGGSNEYVDYAASKGAVDTLGLGLAKEVAAEGVRVNVVRPGIIDTEIHARGGQPNRIEQMLPMLPMGRAGEAAEIADAVVWLLGDEASYCTGSILDVAGGR